MKHEATLRQKYGPAMRITDQEAADLYFEELVQQNMGWGHTREEAEKIERSNLGYWAGYYDNDTRRRVEKLFRCEHPVFGSNRKEWRTNVRAGLQCRLHSGR